MLTIEIYGTIIKLNKLWNGFQENETIYQKKEVIRIASIREVARIAQVSPATVSRVINGTAKVDEVKRQRVLDAINETDFHPNELARALFKKSSKIIGMIVPNIENPFFHLYFDISRKTEDNNFDKIANKVDYTNVYTSATTNFEVDGIKYLTVEQMQGDNAAKYMKGSPYCWQITGLQDLMRMLWKTLSEFTLNNSILLSGILS